MDIIVPLTSIKSWGNLKRFYIAQANVNTIYQKNISKPAIEAAYLDLTILTKKGNIKKQGQWIWYIFPQFLGLGKSANNIKYSISNFKEGIKYLEDPILRNNLIIMTELILTLNKIDKIFGSTDYRKLRSSMTLFKIISTKINDKSTNLFTKACEITGTDIETIKLIENDPLYKKLSTKKN